jgi:probable phosphoglycerate mutase
VNRDVPLLAAPFCFLRHGETENNRLALVAGASDVPLNATGLAQAQAAAQRLTSSGIDAIWASPLQRAHDTARCVASVLGLEIVVVPELAERNWGELEGRPRELRVRGMTPPGGESLEVFRARTLAGFARIAPSRLPLIVAHSGTFRVLCEWLDIPQQAEPVANSQPLRLHRDDARDGAWISEAV